jgi:tetrahydromethanopterin S-methyltransferase subunit F
MDDNNNFRMKTAEFRGYTIKALEDMDKDIDEIKTTVNDIREKLTNQSIKVGVIGGVMGLIAGIIVTIILNSVVV